MTRPRASLIGVGVVLGVLVAALTTGTALRWAQSEEAYHTETGPLEDAFPQLGPLSDARWVTSSDDDRSIPPPDRMVSGFASLQPGKLAELMTARPFAAAHPDLEELSWFEEPLEGLAPDDPRWLRSEAFDQLAASNASFYFDLDSDTVFFRATNP